MQNVLLITIDCLRADRLGAAGYPRALTPNIDRLAKDSAIFSQAYAAGPRTAESFPAILASTYSLTIGGQYALPPDLPRLAQVLQRAGYATAAFHSNPFLSVSLGYAEGFDRFWDSLDETPLTSRLGARAMRLINCDSRVYKFLRRLVRGFEARTGLSYYARAEKVTAMALAWLRDQSGPVFAWLHYMDMHYPFSPPAEYLRQVRPQRIPKAQQADLMVRVLEDPGSLNVHEAQVIIDLYDAGLRYVDANVGYVLGELERSGALDDTLLILTGDHGEEFLEHGDFGHGALIHKPDGDRARVKLYDELLHVPLLVRAPSLGAVPRTCPALASLIDLPPTVVDLLGLESPQAWQGLSLAPLLMREHTSLRPGVFSGYAVRDDSAHYPVVAYRTAGWKYIHDGLSGNHELYDLQNDPGERSNLFAIGNGVLPDLQAAVRAHLKAVGIPDKPAAEAQLDPEIRDRMRALGYLE